jgi:dTDP-glucose pyrophosphorylase
VRQVSKAVVLAAGLGTRMRAASANDRRTGSLQPEQVRAADAGLKAMMPVGRPFLDYALHNLADAGITDACIVIGPEHGVVREHYAGVATTRIALSFAVQRERRGTADAVAAAASFIGADHVLVVNGDNVYPTSACRTLCEYGGPALAGFSATSLVADGLIPQERLIHFAFVEARDGWLTRIVEKPDPAAREALGPDLLISMNCWLLPPAIVEVAHRLPLSPRGELELPLAVQAMVAEGTAFRVIPCNEPVLDLSMRTDIAVVAERLRGRAVRL